MATSQNKQSLISKPIYQYRQDLKRLGKDLQHMRQKEPFCCDGSVKPWEETRRSLKWVEETDSDEYIPCVEVKEGICAVSVNGNKDKVFAAMLLNGRDIRFQLDSGATVNIISE